MMRVGAVCGAMLGNCFPVASDQCEGILLRAVDAVSRLGGLSVVRTVSM